MSTVQRTCGQQDVTIRVLTDYGLRRLHKTLEALEDDSDHPENRLAVGRDGLRTVKREIRTTVVDECPVIDTEVDVDFQRTGRTYGIERWTCPVCGFEHETEVEAE